jgi:hypothetical protein
MAGASIKNKGLFTCRVFEENELITEYTGPRITREQALELRKEGRASHVKGINYDFCIDGDQQPTAGQGIAQFANDSTREGKNNAKFDMKFDNSLGEMRCFIKAMRLLRADEEIFVGYGKVYWLTDRTTGEKIYDEDFASKYMERVKAQEEQEEERRIEQDKRKVENKERARVRRIEKEAEERRVEEEKQAVKQQRADERTKEREVENKKRAKIREREREIRARERELENAQKRKMKLHERGMASEKIKAQRELLAQMTRKEQADFEERLVAKKEEARLERAKVAAAKKKVEQKRLDVIRAQKAEVENAKRARIAIENKAYKKLESKWEKDNGRNITSSAAWALWEVVRAT